MQIMDIIIEKRDTTRYVRREPRASKPRMTEFNLILQKPFRSGGPKLCISYKRCARLPLPRVTNGQPNMVLAANGCSPSSSSSSPAVIRSLVSEPHGPNMSSRVSIASLIC